MSYLDKEDEEWLYISRSVYDEPDEFSEWEMTDDLRGMRYSQKIQEAEHYACTRLFVEYRIHKETGEVEILGVS